MRGAGGKTTLARALCHNERVQEAFYDGILWVTLGKEPGNLIEKVNDLIEILSSERPGFKSIESATNHFVELLDNMHMLIVIDDVWNALHLRPFLQGGTQCHAIISKEKATGSKIERNMGLQFHENKVYFLLKNLTVERKHYNEYFSQEKV